MTRERGRNHRSINEVKPLQDLLEISALRNHDLAASLSDVYMGDVIWTSSVHLGSSDYLDYP